MVLHDTSPKERLMRIAILKKLEMARDYKLIARMHRNYWTNHGAKFFAITDGAFEEDFLPNCTSIFDGLEKVISDGPIQFDKIVEIGTGKGYVLNYLSNRFPNIEKFIGLDLSLEQININKETYKLMPKLEFVATDAMNWIKEHEPRATIFVTFGGVLEYFT